ncbi:VWA domain-containing protein, partial [Bradyrhizobium sp.]
RIAWLNPMMAWDGYAPEAKGIKAALPFVDLYAPANTLSSLAALEPYLTRM